MVISQGSIPQLFESKGATTTLCAYAWDVLLVQPPQGNRPVPYTFPTPLPRAKAGQSCFPNYERNKPAIYRWVVRREGFDTDSLPVALYVGEGVNLGERIKQYCKGHDSQKTNARIHNRFQQEIHDYKAQITIEVLRISQLTIAGSIGEPIQLSDQSFARKATRLLLENMFIVYFTSIYRNSNVEILNIHEDSPKSPRKKKTSGNKKSKT